MKVKAGKREFSKSYTDWPFDPPSNTYGLHIWPIRLDFIVNVNLTLKGTMKKCKNFFPLLLPTYRKRASITRSQIVSNPNKSLK